MFCFRVWQPREDNAKLAAFLISEKSGRITGQVIGVDGGRSTIETQGLIANTMCGGDNAGRGAVLGTLFGAEGGLSCWPERWINGLRYLPEEIFLKVPN